MFVYSTLGPVGKFLYDGLLVMGGLIAFATLIVGIARAEGPPPLLGVGIAIGGLSLTASGLAGLLPARASQASKWVAIAGFAAVYLMLLVGCLFAPGDLVVPAGSSDPSTLRAARLIGIVMLVAAIVIAVMVPVDRRVRRRRSILPPVR